MLPTAEANISIFSLHLRWLLSLTLEATLCTSLHDAIESMYLTLSTANLKSPLHLTTNQNGTHNHKSPSPSPHLSSSPSIHSALQAAVTTHSNLPNLTARPRAQTITHGVYILSLPPHLLSISFLLLFSFSSYLPCFASPRSRTWGCSEEGLHCTPAESAPHSIVLRGHGRHNF